MHVLTLLRSGYRGFFGPFSDYRASSGLSLHFVLEAVLDMRRVFEAIST